MIAQSISYNRCRFPPAIIIHAVWLYRRFNLSLREVEEMFLERGIDVSYETIRRGSVANFYYDWRCNILWTQLPNECSKLLES